MEVSDMIDDIQQVLPYFTPIPAPPGVGNIFKISITNFRAFRGQHEFLFEAKNVLVYGENGSGKTSLWSALDLFFASSLAKSKEASQTDFEGHRYQHNEEYAEVELVFVQGENESLPFKWSAEDSPWSNEEIFPAAKLRACLDYRALWETYFLHRKENQVDIWPLLIETLMPHIESAVTGETFGGAWFVVNNLKPLPARLTEAQHKVLEIGLAEFDGSFRVGLEEIKSMALVILEILSPNLEFDWEIISPQLSQIENRKQWQIIPPKVIVSVSLNGNSLKNHHNLLNEARLSALALSIYLAAAKINAAQARSGFKILALDDVLIGLDMSNRLPVLEVLETYFQDWQIFLFTYDRAWYELAKARLDKDTWKKFEFFASDVLPIWDEDLGLIAKAKSYLQTTRVDAQTRQTINCTPDYRAAGAYARAAFEWLMKETCDKRKIPMPFKLAGDYMIGEMWPTFQKLQMIESTDPNGNWVLLFPSPLLKEIQDCLDSHFNPLCHTQIRQVHKAEVQKAVDALEKLETRIASARKIKLP